MSTEIPYNDDLEDRLLDQALRETLGGETPPDLSGKILAAASESSSDVSTLAANTQSRPAISKRKHWAMFAAAASLLVALGWVVFSSQYNGLRRAKVDTTTQNINSVEDWPNPPSPEQNEESALQERIAPAFEMAIDRDSSLIQPQEEAGEQISKPSAVPAETIAFGITSGPEDSSGNKYSALTTRTRAGGTVIATDALDSPSREIEPPAYAVGRSIKMDLKRAGSPVSGGGVGGGENSPLAIVELGDRGQDLPRIAGEVAVLAKEPVSDLLRRGDLRQLGVQLHVLDEEGIGPETSGDQYTRIHENPFIVAAGEDAVSTFSIDVDTASYANVRQFLMQSGTLPPPDAVRIEELINYFDYNYSGPTGEVPFASHVEIAGCPWHPEHRLVRVGIKGRDIERKSRPQSNLVFLIDVSGSMNEPNKLPLLVEGMKLLTRELGENDRVAIVVYASSEGLALLSTRGDKQDTILAALEKLRAGGSTAGGAGIQLAYQIAQDHFIEGGVNRVILATDGDFNVGTTSTAELERMAETKAKETGVFLTVLGFGRGNLNDTMMEAISGKGNGNYHYVDNQTEARKVLVEEMVGTLITIAKDVKIQIEFNPAKVAGYRLIGYENRMLRTEDFNDDKKDSGEIGAGHTVTALYEIVPAGKLVDAGSVDPLKYQKTEKLTPDGPVSDELLTLKIRYKKPDGDTSTKQEFPISDNGQSFADATPDFKFATAVASFGMLLRNSEHRGDTSYDAVLKLASGGTERDPHGYRAEFLQLVKQAKSLSGE